jgi:phosphoribosylanthranilate isomerase
MSLWVKICGNTTLEDAQLAVDAGADAVGFVFAPSPRQVTSDQVAKIAPSLPTSIEKIGVFVDADFDTIANAVESCGLTGVQLHSDDTGDLASRLRQRFGTHLRILRVIHFSGEAETQLQAAAKDTAINGVLIDSRTANAVGGTGISYDWQAARATIFAPSDGLKLVAAGGLKPDNIAQAIAALQPWGVDVSSGVEAAPGRKDPAKVRAFIANARSAHAELKSRRGGAQPE